MRTQDEIVERIKNLKWSNDDPFGFEVMDLIGALDWEHAREFFKEGTSKGAWELTKEPNDPEYFRYWIRRYLPFAKAKALDMRGLSAIRSVSHFRSWIWLAGDDELLERFEVTEYGDYGMAKIEIIETFYGTLDSPKGPPQDPVKIAEWVAQIEQRAKIAERRTNERKAKDNEDQH